MLDINGIAHIALSVKNISKSKSFYKEAYRDKYKMKIVYDLWPYGGFPY